MILHVKVKPSSGRQEIFEIDDKHFLIYLKSPPEENKANLELLKLLKKYFNQVVKIKSGFTSRNKIIEIS